MRAPLLVLAAVLAGSFAFHAYFATHPTTGYQSSDERSYGKLALNLAEDRQYGAPKTKMREPLHWPPGAPMLFAAGHALFPSERSAETFDLPAAYWLQALVSLGSALLAFGLAWTLAGLWAGVAAAALVGAYPPLILASGEQLSEPLGAALVVAAFAALALAVRRGAWWGYGLAGVGFGAAVLTRADLLLVPFAVGALVVLWLGLRARRRRGDPLLGAVGAGALVVAGAVLVTAPWSLYASNRTGGFVPVTTGSGSALFVGTYLPGNGTTVGMKRALGAELKRRNPNLAGVPDFDLEARLVLKLIADRHPELPEGEAVALEGRRNISRYGRADPVGFAAMMLNKVQRMWTRYARGGARPTSLAIRVWHVALVLFCVAGLAVGIWRGRSLVLATIALAIASSTAVHMLVVSQARYNLPLMPALIAGGVAGWALLIRARRRPEAAGTPGTPVERSTEPATA